MHGFEETSAAPLDDPTDKRPWYQLLNRYHWFVLVVAALGWLFDCLDQQLFILARDNAVKALSPGLDPLELGKRSGWAQSIFVAGWALGGLIFGSIGDRFGRKPLVILTCLACVISPLALLFASDSAPLLAVLLGVGWLTVGCAPLVLAIIPGESVPISRMTTAVALVLLILVGLWWAVYHGQFEDVESEGTRIIEND